MVRMVYRVPLNTFFCSKKKKFCLLWHKNETLPPLHLFPVKLRSVASPKIPPNYGSRHLYGEAHVNGNLLLTFSYPLYSIYLNNLPE